MYSCWAQHAVSAARCGGASAWALLNPSVCAADRFDLAFILSHFHGAVPLDVVAFRRRVLTLFRGVWDTKAVAQQLGVGHTCTSLLCRLDCHRVSCCCAPAAGGTGLGSLFSTCTFDTNALHSLECDRYRAADSAGSVAGGQFPHEAGYDAFMTGCVLLELGINRGDLAYDDDGLLRRDHDMANKGASCLWLGA